METIAEYLTFGHLSTFIIIALGLALGKIKIKGISLGVSAVIFVALFFGHYGIIVPKTFQTLGLILFIYSIGIQAGPGFFESFKKNGLNMALLVFQLVLVGSLSALAVHFIYGVDTGLIAGIFAGALTSTPGLAAASETVKSESVSIGYGIAYPFGVIGVILFVNIIPKILKINIRKEEEKYKSEVLESHPEIMHKHFRVKNANVFNKSIEELSIRKITGATISRVKQDNEVIIPTAKTRLLENNAIRAVGDAEALQKVTLLIGPETTEDIPLPNRSEVKWVLVSNKAVVGKSLTQLNLFSSYNATITRIRRSGIDLTPDESSTIRLGDKLLIACRGNMDAVSKLLGNSMEKLSETDFLPIAIGILAGILVGSISIPLPGGLSFKLGLTGGILTTALILSRLGNTGKIVWNISGPANQFLRQLGLLFFLSAVGTQAGSTLIQTIQSQGLQLFAYGAVITLLPMATTLFIGYYILKFNFLSLMGIITGGMTSTPGLSATSSLSNSGAPSLAYATVYPVALVAVILAIQLISYF